MLKLHCCRNENSSDYERRLKFTVYCLESASQIADESGDILYCFLCVRSDVTCCWLLFASFNGATSFLQVHQFEVCASQAA